MSNISFEMHDRGVYQKWVDDIFETLEREKPGFTEQDVQELLKYCQQSLKEELENNIDTYFHP
jgi:hypothetical protein